MLKGLKIFTYMYFISRKFNCDSQCLLQCAVMQKVYICVHFQTHILYLNMYYLKVKAINNFHNNAFSFLDLKSGN